MENSVMESFKKVQEASDALQETLDRKDPVLEILEKLPPVSINNSRQIFLEAVERYRRNPNDRNAHTLENLGLSVDHDDRFEHMGEWEQSDFNTKKYD